MLGLMQDHPLTLPHVFHRAERLFGDKAIVTATAAARERTTYGDVGRAHPPPRRRRSTSSASRADGRVAHVRAGTPRRHLELYFAAPCTGRVLHTLNIRLFPEQLELHRRTTPRTR